MQSNDRSPSGRRPGAWLRAALRPGEISTEVGWMGGNPRLPDGFEWPTRNSRPYVFLCQINCACLPAEIWDGRGPRTGWLAFFSEYLAGRADMRVIHAPDLGPERRNDEAWVKDVGPLYRIDSTFERFIGSPVSWPLEIVRPADGKSARPPRLRQRPGSSEEKLVAAPEHRPFDWDTLELLLLDAVHSAHQQLDRLANSVRQQEADMLPPPAELPAAYDELRRMNERLGMALAAWNPARPFNFASWMSHADFLVPIRQLHFEIELQSDGDFHRLTNYHVFEHFVYPGHPPAYFPPESPQGRHHAELHRRVDELREKFEADPAIPRKDGKISRDDKAGWKKFRAEFPGAWARYAEEVRQLRYQQIQFWAENAVAVVGRLGKDADGWMPKDITHDGALQRALAGQRGAINKLEKLAAPADTEKLQANRQRLVETERFVAQLETELNDIRNRSDDLVFDPEQWSALYRYIDEEAPAGAIHSAWSRYLHLRSEVAKRVCAMAPQAVDRATHRHLEERWQFEAEQATLQLGGELPEEDEIVGHLVLRIPTNHLINVAWGDVDDLSASVRREDMARSDFRLVYTTVSN